METQRKLVLCIFGGGEAGEEKRSRKMPSAHQQRVQKLDKLIEEVHRKKERKHRRRFWWLEVFGHSFGARARTTKAKC